MNDVARHVPTIVAVVSTFFATVLVVLRMISRMFYTRNVGWDDWMAVAALLFIYPTSALTILADFDGQVGQQPLEETPNSAVVVMLKCIYINLLIYPIAISTVRASILLFYWRIASLANSFVRKGTQVMMIGAVVYIIVVEIMVLQMCPKVSDVWNLTVRSKKCGDDRIHYITTTVMALSILADVIIFLLPLRMIYTTKLPRREKLIVFLLFSIGFVAVGITCFRLTWWELKNSPSDFAIAWNALPYSYWVPVQLEGTMALSAASIPMLRHLFTRKPHFRRQTRYELENRHSSENFKRQNSNGRVRTTAITTLVATANESQAALNSTQEDSVGADRPPSQGNKSALSSKDGDVMHDV